MNKLFIPVLWIACLFLASCSNNDEPSIPSDAIPLNMMVGDDDTTIGGSDVYINSSLNFTTSNCGIADLGKKSSFISNPNLIQIAQEVAVTPGHYYQITLSRDIKTVAGMRAYPINANFYNVYADSWIYDKEKDIVGAKISYTESYPYVKGLPEWDSKVKVKLEYDKYFWKAEYSFPKGCKIDDQNVDTYLTDGYKVITDQLNIEINDNRIELSYPSSGEYPYVRLLVRYENVYTRVYLDFFED